MGAPRDGVTVPDGTRNRKDWLGPAGRREVASLLRQAEVHLRQFWKGVGDATHVAEAASLIRRAKDRLTHP